MSIGGRTPEGWPSNCLTCGKEFTNFDPPPLGDVICPDCASKITPGGPEHAHEGAIRRLESLGAFAETDAEEQVRKIKFVGKIYDDSTVEILAGIEGLEMMDIMATAITRAGAARLRQLLPDTVIKCRRTQ